MLFILLFMSLGHATLFSKPSTDFPLGAPYQYKRYLQPLLGA